MEMIFIIIIVWLAWSSAKDYSSDELYWDDYDSSDSDSSDYNAYGDDDGDGISNWEDDDYYR